MMGLNLTFLAREIEQRLVGFFLLENSRNVSFVFIYWLRFAFIQRLIPQAIVAKAKNILLHASCL